MVVGAGVAVAEMAVVVQMGGGMVDAAVGHEGVVLGVVDVVMGHPGGTSGGLQGQVGDQLTVQIGCIHPSLAKAAICAGLSTVSARCSL